MVTYLDSELEDVAPTTITYVDLQLAYHCDCDHGYPHPPTIAIAAAAIVWGQLEVSGRVDDTAGSSRSRNLLPRKEAGQ